MNAITRLLACLAVTVPVLLASSVASAVPVDPASDEGKAISARVEAYLNDMTTLHARFLQIAPDGGQSTGTLDIHRPARLRLDYDPPSRVLIVTRGWDIVFADAAARQVSYFPVNSTPIGFLLAEDVALDDEVIVTGIDINPGEIDITVVQADEPELGEVTLVFGDQPMELRRWVVTDVQRLTTMVLLEDLETGIEIDPELFRFKNPRMYGWPAED